MTTLLHYTATATSMLLVGDVAIIIAAFRILRLLECLGLLLGSMNTCEHLLACASRRALDTLRMERTTFIIYKVG